MNMKKRGLGKGLSDLGLGALLGDINISAIAIDENETISTTNFAEDNRIPADGQLKKLPITILKPGKYQPRKIISSEALEELANSIRMQGVIQPIVVRPIANNHYEIIAGERRWRAAQLAELHTIPAIIRDINDETAMIMGLIENIQRHDLNVMEEAGALDRLMTEFNMTHQAIADATGKSRAAVTNLLRLLKLHPAVRKQVEDGKLEMGHARALLVLDDEKQMHAANIIIARGLSVREIEDYIRNVINSFSENNSKKPQKIILHTLQNHLKQKFGVKVTATQNAKGRGKLVLHYRNEKELERVCYLLGTSLIID